MIINKSRPFSPVEIIQQKMAKGCQNPMRIIKHMIQLIKCKNYEQLNPKDLIPYTKPHQTG